MPANPHAQALGRMGKGKRKTITPAAQAARKANAAKARRAKADKDQERKEGHV